MWIQMQDVVPSESVEEDETEEMATLEQFERCLDACGFGKYQWWMLSISLLGVLSHVSVMGSMPYSLAIGDEEKYIKEVKIILFMIPYLETYSKMIYFAYFHSLMYQGLKFRGSSDSASCFLCNIEQRTSCGTQFATAGIMAMYIVYLRAKLRAKRFSSLAWCTYVPIWHSVILREPHVLWTTISRMASLSADGMICSSVISGFISDSFGRRKVIIVCYAGLTVATILEGAGRHYILILLAKYLEGFFLGGAFVASTTLQAEFQTEKSRDRIMVTLNFFVTLSQVLIILPGFTIAPLIWNNSNIGDVFDLHHWDIYILFNSIFSLAACLLYAWLPDSPKSDFVHGRYKDALQTVKRIYSVNTGKSSDEFPYQLLGMTDNEIKSHREQVRATWSKVKLILKKPLLKYLIIIAATQVTFSLGYNTMRLWHPTLLSVINYSPGTYFNSTTYLCGAFDESYIYVKIGLLEEVLHHVGNGVITFMFGLIPYIIVTIFINIGKRLIILITLCVCCCCIISMYWVNGGFENTFVFGVFLAFGQLFIGLIQAVVVEIFPVWTKSLALSLTLTASAIGAVLAEVMFSSLLPYGCALASIVATIIASAALFSLFLLKT